MSVSHLNAIGKYRAYNLFANRKMAIATMHGKEQVIAPILSDTFQVKCEVPTINTDLFGTFSGEIERSASFIATARKKCIAAMDQSGLQLAIANEGSFGSHPHIPFASANEEIVLLLDKKNEIEIWGRSLSTQTNFSCQAIHSYEEALHFARKVGFPLHGLIIRDKEGSHNKIHKGVNDPAVFKKIVSEMLSDFSSIWIETDMRAMYNPTRLIVINEATQNLIEKLTSHCPDCNFPGYWIEKAIPGLACSQCGLPTKSPLYFRYSCINCDHTSEKKYPQLKTSENPQFCDFCNP